MIIHLFMIMANKEKHAVKCINVVPSALVNGQLLQLPGNVGGVPRYGNVGKLVFTQDNLFSSQLRAEELQPAGQVVHVGGDGEVWDVELVPVL